LFLDAYSGNHQMSLTIDDDGKTTFAFWDLLLHQDGIRAEKQESNLSEVHSHHLGASHWEKR
jgi:outer membrane protein assembly factor BamE (lipoprotein component of BamABCDE complex)